ncbi:hypothetical protein AGMMS4957_13550 [Bacteroidia bacterium]|nr:hypothetical protein AGMMS4957_13550 [Bacteroidia bacterium]
MKIQKNTLPLQCHLTNAKEMGTKELLEFEAKGYVEGRNIVPPTSVTPTHRGHANKKQKRHYASL